MHLSNIYEFCAGSIAFNKGRDNDAFAKIGYVIYACAMLNIDCCLQFDSDEGEKGELILKINEKTYTAPNMIELMEIAYDDEIDRLGEILELEIEHG